MPRSHIHGSSRRFHYGSNPTDDPGKYNFRSRIWMHNASTNAYDYGCNTELYGLIWIATDDAGPYPWLNLGIKVNSMLKGKSLFKGKFHI